ncbi:low molecular weight phosphatase family protein [Jatrophihabitans fulvus]
MTASFSVLFVCTANICRSAMAAQLFRASVGPVPNVVVRSAGTHALVGHGLDEPSAAALAELGCAVAPHGARQLGATEAAEADLVLAATTAQRAEIVATAPSALERAFTLREFARLSRDLPAGPPVYGDRAALVGRVVEVAARRGSAAAAPPGIDEVGDPFAAPWVEVQRCAVAIRDAVVETARILGLPPAPADDA